MLLSRERHCIREGAVESSEATIEFPVFMLKGIAGQYACVLK